MSESKSLISLTTEYLQAAEHLSQLDLDEDVIADALEEKGYQIEVKAASCAHVWLQMKSVRDGIKARIDEMDERKKHYDRKMKSLENYMMRSLTAVGIKKIEHPDFQISVRDNPEHVVIDFANQVPDEYLRIPAPPPPELDKKKIMEAIKSGVEVPGAHLERTKRVKID